MSVGDLLFRDECYQIIGLCMKVHSRLGPGFKEIVYKDALELEFIKNNIPYVREMGLKVEYDSEILRHGFNADFEAYGSILLEIKSTSEIHPDHIADTINYLKVAKKQLGLLINFGERRLKFMRVVLSEKYWY